MKHPLRPGGILRNKYFRINIINKNILKIEPGFFLKFFSRVEQV